MGRLDDVCVARLNGTKIALNQSRDGRDPRHLASFNAPNAADQASEFEPPKGRHDGLLAVAGCTHQRSDGWEAAFRPTEFHQQRPQHAHGRSTQSATMTPALPGPRLDTLGLREDAGAFVAVDILDGRLAEC